MGYTRIWTPPAIPLKENLENWQVLCQDIHDNLVMAGLVWDDADQNQLDDFEEVEEYPADNTFAGYRIYRFDDALQSSKPIFIKLSFGAGKEGQSTTSNNSRNQTLRIRLELQLEEEHNIPYVTEFPTAETSTVIGSQSDDTSIGTSYASYFPERGFFAFFYGVGSRRLGSQAGGAGAGHSLGFIIQRDLDSSGSPAATGFCIYQFQYYESINSSTVTPRFRRINLEDQALEYADRSAFARPLAGIVGHGDNPQLHPVAILDSDNLVTWNPNLFTLRIEDAAHQHIFEAAPAPNMPPNTYIALHPQGFGTNLDCSICMIWEDD